MGVLSYRGIGFPLKGSIRVTVRGIMGFSIGASIIPYTIFGVS